MFLMANIFVAILALGLSVFITNKMIDVIDSIGRKFSRSPDIAKLKEQRDLKQLLGALHHHNAATRRQAVEALGNLGDRQATTALAVAYTDDDSSVRLAAQEALTKLGASPIETLVTSFEQKDVDVRLRLAAATALGKLDDPRAIDALTVALADNNIDVRHRATMVLASLKDPRVVDALSVALTDKEWIVAVTAATELAKFGERAVEPLITALKHTEGAVRLAAVQSLGNIGDVRAVDALTAALKDDDNDVRQEAKAALKHLGV